MPGSDDDDQTGEFAPVPVEPPADWYGGPEVGWNSLEAHGIAPIAGGSPEFDDAPFEPSDADLACYLEWCRQADQETSSPVLSLHRLTAIADALYPGQPVAAR